MGVLLAVLAVGGLLWGQEPPGAAPPDELEEEAGASPEPAPSEAPAPGPDPLEEALRKRGGWHRKLTPHFELLHEARLLPPGFALGLESLHGRMRLDLYALAPWMGRERIRVFLFKTPESYAASPFKPPPWSNGLSFVQKRLILVHEQPDPERLLQIVAHEMSHVLFESFFAERGREPPVWLTEGVAMLMESPQSLSGEEERGNPWYQLLHQGGVLRVQAAREFVETVPGPEMHADRVGDWYLQAYGLVRFLMRDHSRLQFRAFCTKLRDGEAVEKAFWSVYRFAKLEDLDAAWHARLEGRSSPRDRFRLGPLGSPRPAPR